MSQALEDGQEAGGLGEGEESVAMGTREQILEEEKEKEEEVEEEEEEEEEEDDDDDHDHETKNEDDASSTSASVPVVAPSYLKGSNKKENTSMNKGSGKKDLEKIENTSAARTGRGQKGVKSRTGGRAADSDEAEQNDGRDIADDKSKTLAAASLGAAASSSVVFACKLCRRQLFELSDVTPHFDAGLRSGRRTEDGACAALFVRLLPWMECDGADGKLACPQCGAKVGRWSLAGIQCSCGGFCSPGRGNSTSCLKERERERFGYG